MSRKKFFATIAFSLMVGSLLQAQTTWTLDQCVSYALENNLQVKQSQLTAESATADVKQSKAALFPSLTFGVSQQLGFQKIESQDVASNVSHPENPTYTGSYQLNASVTLYDGGSNWRTIKKNKLSVQNSQLESEMTIRDVQERIISAYYQILYAHESVLTDEEILKTAEKELERTRELLNVGQASKVDVAQMESQYQQNEYQLVTARNTEAANVLALKQLLQLNTDTEFSVDYTSFSTDDVMALIPSASEAEALALSHLPDMKAAQVSVEMAKMSEKIAKSGYSPTLSLNASASTSNGNSYTGDFSTQIKDHVYGSVGLSLSVPIYDRRVTRTSVDKAKINTANEIYAQENTRLELCNMISSLHLDILSAQSRYESAVKSEASAQESYDLMAQRYNVGLESLVDLLTEKNTLLSAKQETLQSKYTALLNSRLLRFYTGQ